MTVAIRADLEDDVRRFRSEVATLRYELARAKRERDALLSAWPEDGVKGVVRTRSGEWMCFPSSGVVRTFRERADAVRA